MMRPRVRRDRGVHGPREGREALWGEENSSDLFRHENGKDGSQPIVDTLLARVERCLAILRELKGG